MSSSCWDCGAPPGGGPFCEACGKVQPQGPMDHFSLLGLPRRFALDTADLEHRYRDLQRTLHPDRFVTLTDRERRFGMTWAATLNDAYRTLRDPARRAEYLLGLAGVPPHGEGKGGGPADPELLEEMLELRELLAVAKAARDARGVEALAGRVRADRERTLADIGARIDAGSARDALPLVVRLRYLARFLDDVTAFEEAALA